MKELSEASLTSKLRRTISKCAKSKKYKKVMESVMKHTNTKPIFWENIVKDRYKPILNVILKYIYEQKETKNTLTYLYSSKFTSDLKKKKTKKEKMPKEIHIMQMLKVATKDVLAILKKNHKSMK